MNIGIAHATLKSVVADKTYATTAAHIIAIDKAMRALYLEIESLIQQGYCLVFDSPEYQHGYIKVGTVRYRVNNTFINYGGSHNDTTENRTANLALAESVFVSHDELAGDWMLNVLMGVGPWKFVGVEDTVLSKCCVFKDDTGSTHRYDTNATSARIENLGKLGYRCLEEYKGLDALGKALEQPTDQTFVVNGEGHSLEALCRSLTDHGIGHEYGDGLVVRPSTLAQTDTAYWAAHKAGLRMSKRAL